MTPVVRKTCLVIMLAVVAGVGGWIRWGNLDDPLWIDELHTAWVVDGEWNDVIPRSLAGNQTPLYFLSIKLFEPEDPVSVRLPSWNAGVLLVLICGVFVFRWTGSLAAAFLTSALVTLQEHCILFAQEARPYAWVQCVATLFVCSWAERIRRPEGRGWRILFVVSGVALPYLHLTALLLWVVPLVVLPRSLRSQARVDALILLASLVPLALHLMTVEGRKENWGEFIPQETLGWLLFQQMHFHWFTLLPAGVALLVALATRSRVAKPSTSRVSDLVLVSAWLLLPAVIAWVATSLDAARVLYPRYLVAIVPAACILTGLASSWLRWELVRWLVAVVTLCGVIANVENTRRVCQDRLLGIQSADWSLTGRYEYWKEAVQEIRERSSLEEPVFLCPGLIEDQALASQPSDALRAFCLFPIQSYYRVEQPEYLVHPLPTQVDGRFDAVMVRQIRQAAGGWILIRADASLVEEIERDLSRSVLDSDHDLLVGYQPFGVLWLMQFKLERVK